MNSRLLQLNRIVNGYQSFGNGNGFLLMDISILFIFLYFLALLISGDPRRIIQDTGCLKYLKINLMKPIIIFMDLKLYMELKIRKMNLQMML